MRLSTLLFFLGFSVLLKAQHVQTPLEKLADERSAYYKAQGIQIKKYRQKYAGLRQATDSDYLLSEISVTGHPVYKAPLNSGLAISSGAAALRDLSLGLNLQGENMLVGVWDDGLVKDHIEFGNRIISKEGFSSQTHMTHVTGIIVASGVNTGAKGMAPKAMAATWYFDNDDAEMASVAKPDQTTMLFSNHSYGTVAGWSKPSGVWTWYGDPSISIDEDYRHGFYSQTAQVLDRLTYLAPYYTVVWAAGNDRGETGDGTHPRDGNGGTVTEGYDCLIPEAVSKNIITVGAVDKVLSYVNPASAVMTSFTSWGPTDDGRIKPDVVGAGTNVFSTSAAGTNQYASLGGTSMATPNVTGSLMLLQELYHKLHGGNYMRASTLKGLMIHTVKEAGSSAGPDYRFGWGLLDVSAAGKTLLQQDNENVFVKELTLANGATYSQEINSQSNQKITITICWTDPAGTPTTPSLDPINLMLVNDLDIRIVDDQGNTQFPWILNPGSPASQATTGDNFRDNVEKIEFVNPPAKKFTIRVTHKGQLTNGRQDFALIITHKSSSATGADYYWIGNSGNWSDGAHWSLNSGGVAAALIPGKDDNVIFDENSFDGLSIKTVNLTADASCKKITWLTDRLAALALNDHRLTVLSDFALSSKNFKIETAGTLRFESTTDRSINILKADFTKANLEINGGRWSMRGQINVNKIDVLKGALMLRDQKGSVKNLNATANTTLDISGSALDSLNTSTLHESVVFESTNAAITCFSNALINWNNHTYHGDINVLKNSQVEFLSSANIRRLYVGKNTLLKLTDGVTEQFDSIAFTASLDSVVRIESPGKAKFLLTQHMKYCFDYLTISNVDITGNAIVNAGTNSSLINAANWLSEVCTDVLFSDFAAEYTCLNSYTSFTDRSLGNITSWMWNFGDEASSDNSSTKKDVTHKFSGIGLFTVTLTISDGNVTRSFAKEIQIGNNDLVQTNIVSSGGVLVSARLAGNYQWYKNDEIIAGATSRSYDYAGDVGSYVVVTGNTTCNSVSPSFIITGVENVNESVQIFPNPADTFIAVKAPMTSKPTIVLYDALGRPILRRKFSDSESIDVSTVKDGVYVLEVKSTYDLVRRKVIINHGE